VQGLTLVVVLLFGLGSVLVMSAIETDPATGKSVSVLQTIANVWNNQLDFSQPASSGGGGGGGGFAYYVPPSPSTATLAAQTYTNASVAAYLRTRRM
jgi:hypothetical protein